jgi:hypothetical protein
MGEIHFHLCGFDEIRVKTDGASKLNFTGKRQYFAFQFLTKYPYKNLENGSRLCYDIQKWNETWPVPGFGSKSIVIGV